MIMSHEGNSKGQVILLAFFSYLFVSRMQQLGCNLVYLYMQVFGEEQPSWLEQRSSS